MFYTYNRAGNLVSQTYPSGKVVETAYDGGGPGGRGEAARR